MKPLALAAALAVLSVPALAGAHGVEAQVERSGGSVSVRARYHGGRPLAGARYEVVSPADPGRARDAGRTDVHGWLVFEPDAPGAWRVRIADAGGHGRVVEVRVAPEELGAGDSSTPEPLHGSHGRDGRDERATPEPPGGSRVRGEREAADDPSPGPLRIAAGAAGILALFGGVFLVQRRRRGAR